jgi:hypothetical protein
MVHSPDADTRDADSAEDAVEARERRPAPPSTWLPRADWEVLGIWLLTRVAVAVIVMAGAWNLNSQPFSKQPNESFGPPLQHFTDRFAQWDFVHFQAIAQVWYDPGQPTNVPLEAFFPGLPVALRFAHSVGFSYVAGGLVVSLIAGAVAMVALRRLGDLEFGPGVGSRTVVLLTLAPTAIFLAAPYTEALFLGFAIPAWLAARRGRWPLAAVLTCFAGTVRVSGLFLAGALVVEFLTSPRRDWKQAPWLAVSVAGPAAYMVYLWRHTGDPLRWLHAQSEGWGRSFHWPWEAAETTWHAAFERTDLNANYTWMERAELIATAIGIVGTIVLLVWRRWGEATWVGLQVVAFATSVWFFSVPRATLLWWPLWIFLAVWTLRHRWMLWVYLAVSAPLMAVWVAAYTMGGHWTG